MKVGIVPINVGVSSAQEIGRVARAAEAAGLESVWTFEHVVVPERYESRYPYHPKGKMPVKPETPFVDPFVALSYAAGVTRELKLGTGVNILPQTNPLLAAKQVASLDFVSDGRFLFGVGVGWLEEEYEALGVSFARRGARFDDYLVAMKKVWSPDVVQHRGEFVEWSGFKSYPLPVQRPHPPLIIGGTSKRAFRRVALHGDGWFAPNNSVEELEDLLVGLDAALAEHGRTREDIEITAMWLAGNETQALSELRDLGVARVVVPLASLGEADPAEAIEKLAELAKSG